MFIPSPRARNCAARLNDRPAQLRARGFTLIEILVVIVILSVSIGVVVINFSANNDADIINEEISRLQQLFRFAHQQSVIRAEEYGVRFYKTGYRFMQLDEENDTWVDINKDRLLRYRQLAEPLEINLYIDQLSVELLQSRDDDPEPEPEPDAEVEEETENELATAASAFSNNINKKTAQAKKDKIKPQIFLLSSSELSPAFEVIIRLPGSDIEKQLTGLAQGEYELEPRHE